MMMRDDVKTIGLVLLTSDRGLAGSYNVSMVTLAERFLNEFGKPAKVIADAERVLDTDAVLA